MKDNNDWNDGSLKPELYPTWALYFSKYIRAYEEQGIDIWGVTIENEPLGNGGQWESMIFTPETMAEFLKHHLGPRFEQIHGPPHVQNVLPGHATSGYHLLQKQKAFQIAALLFVSLFAIFKAPRIGA